MKKLCILLLALTVFAGVLSACKNAETETPSGGTGASLGKIAAKASGKDDSNATDDLASSADEANNPTGEVGEHELNAEVFDDIGLAFEQVEAKRGKKIDQFYEEGGYADVFENGFGGYVFNQTGCNAIVRIPITKLFAGVAGVLTPEEIGAQYGIRYLSTYENGLNDNYGSNFATGKIEIVVFTSEEGKITPESTVRVSDRFYWNIYMRGFSEDIITSKYQIFGCSMIGVPEGATIEDFLSQSFVQNWVAEYGKFVFEKDGMEVKSGSLIPGMIVKVDTFPYKIIACVK